MSKSQSNILSPARSQGSVPRRPRTRRTLSVASPRSEASVKLSTVVERFVKDDFVLSPMNRRSVLPDDTAIEAPRRASWWKRLDGSSRDVLEALDTNKMTDDLLVEEYEFEVQKDKKDQSVPEISDNESVASIVVPQRRLFNRKTQAQDKFADIMGSRKSLGKTNIEDESIEVAPKNLFNKGPRNRPVFPAALLNSTNKTINKTVEPEPSKQTRPNLFGQAGTKRKNMFTDFDLLDSEEDSEVQHKVFGFKKNNNKRISLGTRTRRMPSLTPSMTTEIDIDDWNLLPSSTMIGAQEVSKMSIDNIEQVPEDKQDETLTEEIAPINQSRSKKSIIQDDENDKTLTNENIEVEDKNVSKKSNSSVHNLLNESAKRKSSQNKSSTRPNAEHEEIIDEVVEQQIINTGTNQLIANKPSVEDEMAELHGETIVKEKSQQLVLPNRTDINLSKSGQEITSVTTVHEGRKDSISANKTNKNEDGHLSEKEKSKEELEHSNEIDKSQNHSNEASDTNQDENKDDASGKDESEEVEPSVEDQESQDHSEEASKTNEDVDDEKEESEEEPEPSAVEEESENVSKERSQEESHENEDEDMEASEKEDTEEVVEQSDVEQESENEDEEEDNNEEENEPSVTSEASQNVSKEASNENQDEHMEEMVWNDNDEEMPSDKETENNVEADQIDDVAANQKGNLSKEVNEQKEANKTQNITHKSHRIVDASMDNDQVEENDVVDETPNNSTHDTTGRNRKRVSTKVKSPEAVLQNMTNDNESFRPIGRSTTFRKSKSVYETMHMRPSLAPVQESTLGSEGSRNSSTEGSEWDSHRTTRKTIRQTLGKDYTTRKSLRALVMEQSAKRETDLYNKTHLNKTKNKTIVDDGTDKNASKMNKTKNKTDVEDTINKNASTVNKTKNKTILDDTNTKNAAVNKTKNKSVLDDIDDQHIRFRRTSNRNLSGNASPISKSPVHGTSTHHVPDPLISEQQVSYHKSLHDIKEPEISTESYREDSINLPNDDDSGPELSIHASYGQGMSADTHHETSNGKESDVDMLLTKSDKTKEFSRRDASVRTKSTRDSEEVLDYEASEDENIEQESEAEIDQENVEQDEEKEDSEEVEAEETEKEESEQENEDSQQEIEAESDKEESEVEIEPESEPEVEPEFETELSQEDINPDSDKEDSQQEIEVESDQEESQQQIEAESEAESEDPESEIEQDHDISENNEVSQEPEPASDDDNDDFISRVDSETELKRASRSRVVFDSELMSDEEIDFEGVSRQTRDITEQSERSELSRSVEQESRSLRVSEPSHNISVNSKKTMLIAQMQKIAQQNMEIRQKIRDEVQRSLKPPNRNMTSPVPNYCVRRVVKEPRQPKKKPKPALFAMESLPKAFVEDLMYKPPKRFQPANAPWITKRLYKYLETKLEPKYDYRARVRAEELVQTMYSFAKLVRRRDVAPAQAVDELKREMARLKIVTTHFEFYEFFHEFMPREVRIKVNPDVVNRIPMPRNGIFGDILQPRATAVE